MKYSNETLTKMYHDLVRGRLFVERLHQAVSEGMIRTSLHSSYGQEAVDVGILSSMKPTDWFVPNHRSQAALLCRMDAYELFCEICGKADGPFKGVAYDYHIADLSDGCRIAPNSAVLGGQAPTSLGFAFALKYRKIKGEAVVATYGDGNASEGATSEAYNLASLYKAPIVFAIINNEWAMTVPLSRQSSNPNISDRAIPCGLKTQIVDGYDILAVREAMENALALARENEPNVVEFKLLRWSDHFVGQGGAFRTDRDRVEEDKAKNDPVKKYEKYLLDNQVLDQQYFDEYKAKTKAGFDAIAKRVNECRYPTKEEIFTKEHIYATPETGGEM
jgi:pyruvate dehydrogenase E1 component alpha subunit